MADEGWYPTALARASTWSSTRDGRWVLGLMLVAYLSALGVLCASRGWDAGWKALGVEASSNIFLDARFVTATMDSYRSGHDPFADNACDPYKRPMNYPRIWLKLASSGLSQDHTVIVGLGLAILF